MGINISMSQCFRTTFARIHSFVKAGPFTQTQFILHPKSQATAEHIIRFGAFCTFVFSLLIFNHISATCNRTSSGLKHLTVLSLDSAPQASLNSLIDKAIALWIAAGH